MPSVSKKQIPQMVASETVSKTFVLDELLNLVLSDWWQTS